MTRSVLKNCSHIVIRHVLLIGTDYFEIELDYVPFLNFIVTATMARVVAILTDILYNY